MNPKALSTIVADEVATALVELEELQTSLTLIIDHLVDASEKAAELVDRKRRKRRIPTSAVLGRPITILEARKIALEILVCAEQDRLQFAEAEARRDDLGVARRPRNVLDPAVCGDPDSFQEEESREESREETKGDEP